MGPLVSSKSADSISSLFLFKNHLHLRLRTTLRNMGPSATRYAAIAAETGSTVRGKTPPRLHRVADMSARLTVEAKAVETNIDAKQLNKEYWISKIV